MPVTFHIIGATGGNTVTKDRYLAVPGATTWEPKTYYPGDDVAKTLDDGQSFDLSYPADSDHPSSVSIYFWVNDDRTSPLNSFSPADYGVTVGLDANKVLGILQLAPGADTTEGVVPQGTERKRYVAIGGIKSNDGYLYIFNILKLKVQNKTDGPLPYYINYTNPQPVSIELTDFDASHVNGTIPKGGFPTLELYNTAAFYKADGTTPAANGGLYFYKNTSAAKDPASAAIAFSIQGSAITPPLSGDLTIDQSNYILTVTGSVGQPANSDSSSDKDSSTSDGSSSDSSKKSSKVWMWVGIGIGIIALIVVIAVLIFHNKKKSRLQGME